MRRVESLLQPMIESGEVTNTFATARGDGSGGFMFVTLAPWDKRQRTQMEITAELNRKLQSIPGIQVFAFTANSLGIRGGGQGLQFAITGTDYDDARRRRRQADQGDAAGSGLRHGPAQLRHHPAAALDQDRPRTAPPMSASRSTPSRPSCRPLIAGKDLGNFYIGDDAIEILAQAPDGMIQDPSGLERVQPAARSSGKMVPLSSLVTFEETAVAPTLPRQDQRRAMPMTATLAAGRRPAPGDEPSRGDRRKRTCLPAWASSTPARPRS